MFLIPQYPAKIEIDLFQQHDVGRLADFHWEWRKHQHHFREDIKQLRCDPAWLRV